MIGPGALGQITVLLLAYGAVCVVFGAVFGMALGPSIGRAFARRRPRGREVKRHGGNAGRGMRA